MASRVMDKGEKVAYGVFECGKYQVQPLKTPKGQNGVPKPLLVAVPNQKGKYPVLLLLHGFMMENVFYSQLLAHVASHGYIVVAPQMYTVPWADMGTEITDAEKIVEWMTGSGLDEVLKETEVCGDYERLSIGGHSRGGAVAFAVAERGNVKVSCAVGLDPVDNGVILKGKGHEEWMLEGVGKILVGMALGEQKASLFAPACAPKGRNQREFWTECCGPLFQLVAKEYGHMDVLDDDTPGIIVALSSCACKKGPSRAPARCFAGGCVVAFLAWFLRDDKQALTYIMKNPSSCPVEVETPQSRGVDFDD